MMKSILLVFLGLSWALTRPAVARDHRPKRPPNIIYVLADDLGFNEVGCYGQSKIKTPNIDRIAREGMRFTQHYSGSPVCAPSRCVLLTGKHTGNAYVRDNYEMGGWKRDSKEGQLSLLKDTFTLPKLLQKNGYRTGAMGKWGLGGPDSPGHPNLQGFDEWYGYLCQRVAHNYYPTHLWRNQEKHVLSNPYFAAHQKFSGRPDNPESYAKYAGEDYSMDFMTREALTFVRENKDRPFFLYLPFPVPHVSLQVPEDSLEEYRGKFNDQPYLGNKGYLPHPSPRAAYAAMITRMDRDIGSVLDLLDGLSLSRNTIVFFSSDNGPTFNGGCDREFFDSAGPLHGGKCELYEGGIRVPFVVRWPGHIAAGTISDHVSAFWDVLPTIAEIIGAKTPGDIDGISFLPTLLGRGDQEQHDSLYWEYHARKGMQAVRMGDWKALRLNRRDNPNGPVELYNLAVDLGETKDVSAKNPQVVRKIVEVMNARQPSPIERWNFTSVK